MFALPGERAWVGPGFENEFGGFAEAFSGIGRVLAVRIILGATANDKAAVKFAPEHIVEHGKLFGDLERNIVERQAIAQHHDTGLCDPLRKRGGDQIGRGHNAIGVLVMLIDDHPVETQRIGIGELIDILLIDLRAALGIKQAV